MRTAATRWVALLVLQRECARVRRIRNMTALPCIMAWFMVKGINVLTMAMFGHRSHR